MNISVRSACNEKSYQKKMWNWDEEQSDSLSYMYVHIFLRSLICILIYSVYNIIISWFVFPSCFSLSNQMLYRGLCCICVIAVSWSTSVGIQKLVFSSLSVCGYLVPMHWKIGISFCPFGGSLSMCWLCAIAGERVVSCQANYSRCKLSSD